MCLFAAFSEPTKIAGETRTTLLSLWFWKECAGEIQDKATQLEVFGFPRLKSNTGFVLFECYQAGEADKLIKVDFQSLIFARQMLLILLDDVKSLPTDDRISNSWGAFWERRFPTLWWYLYPVLKRRRYQ